MKELSRLRPHVITALLCLLVSGTVVSLSVRSYPGLSQVDEATHSDYALRLSEGELVRRGDVLSQETLDEMSCRGYQSAPDAFPECGDSPYDPLDYPADGYNYNAFHPPLFYAVDAVGATAIGAVAPVESFLTAARLMGIFWLAAGMFVSWLLFLELSMSVIVARTLAVATGLLPAVVNLSSIVNNDAAAVLAGASVLLTTLAFSRGRVSAWVPIVVALAAAMLKSTFLVAGIAAFLLLLPDAFALIANPSERRSQSRAWQRILAVAVLTALSFGVVQIGWTAVQSERTTNTAYSNPLAETGGTPAEGLPLKNFARQSTAFMPPTRPATTMPQARSPIVEPWLDLTNLLLAGAPIALWLVCAPRSRQRRFASAAIGACVLGALAVTTVFYLRTGTVKATINPRYGLALVPALMACTGMLIDQSRAARWVAPVVTAVGGALLVLHIGGWV